MDMMTDYKNYIQRVKFIYYTTEEKKKSYLSHNTMGIYYIIIYPDKYNRIPGP